MAGLGTSQGGDAENRKMGQNERAKEGIIWYTL